MATTKANIETVMHEAITYLTAIDALTNSNLERIHNYFANTKHSTALNTHARNLTTYARNEQLNGQLRSLFDIIINEG